MWRGRFFACGGLVHIGKQAEAAYKLANAIDNPPKRKPRRPDTQTIEQHLQAIENIVQRVRALIVEGDTPKGWGREGGDDA